jgi:hypothetical protein
LATGNTESCAKPDEIGKILPDARRGRPYRLTESTPRGEAKTGRKLDL